MQAVAGLVKADVSGHGDYLPSAVRQLLPSLPTVARGLTSGKVSPRKALVHPRLPDQKQVRRIFKEIESKDERIELNLYISGYDEDLEGPESREAAAAAGSGAETQNAPEAGQPGMSPEESPTR